MWIYLGGTSSRCNSRRHRVPLCTGTRLLLRYSEWPYFHDMKTKDFIDRLRKCRTKRVLFINSDGATIHAGYHLTELKAASFDTVDCGAQKNRWTETIVQLWVPEDEENGECMTAAKFLSIYDRVARLIPLDPTAEIRFEYGDENFPPSNYHVENISENRTELRVRLRVPQATCKARDGRESGAVCCG